MVPSFPIMVIILSLKSKRIKKYWHIISIILYIKDFYIIINSFILIKAMIFFFLYLSNEIRIRTKWINDKIISLYLSGRLSLKLFPKGHHILSQNNLVFDPRITI